MHGDNYFSETDELSKENSDELAKWLENLLGKPKLAGVKVMNFSLFFLIQNSYKII